MGSTLGGGEREDVMRLVFKYSNGHISILNEGFHRLGVKDFLFFSTNENFKPNENIIDFAKQNKGIVFQEEESSIKIFNDPFRSIPLYITKLQSEEILIFSNPNDCLNFSGFNNLEYDHTGFWETVLYGSGIGTRTIFKNLKQMPAASVINISKETNTVTISRYWNFDIYENSSIDSIDKAGDGLYERLAAIFSKLRNDEQYLLGLSGGVDSRITIAMLSKFVDKNHIKTYTFGYDNRILEHYYAKKVSHILNIAMPYFHLLNASSYEKALRTINYESLGQVGIGHCHTYDYLEKNVWQLNGYKHISTMYSDAVLGWEAVYPKRKDRIEDSSYFKVLPVPLGKSIWEEIRADAEEILKAYQPQYGFSSIDEFKYVTERNVKFHMYLAFLHGKFIDTLTPFADFELLTYMISVPAIFRHNKCLIDYIFDRYFPQLSASKIGNISSRCWWGPQYTNYFNYIEKGIINRLNTVLFRITKGRYQVFDKYMTEVWRNVLYIQLNQKFNNALNTLQKYELINKEQKDFFSKPAISVNSAGIAERFQ